MAISDSGIFWWCDDDELEPPGQKKRVSGDLRIDDNGNITLDLIGALPGRGGIEAVFQIKVEHSRSIRGVLKSAGESVLLRDVFSKGGRDGGGVSFEVMGAKFAIISPEPIQVSKFCELHMPLHGFEAWSHPGDAAYEHDKERRTLSLILTHGEGRRYETTLGEVVFGTGVKGHYPSPMSISVGASLTSSLTMIASRALILEEVIDQFRGFQDLILLLSNSQRLLPWPMVKSLGGDVRGTLYFQRYGDDTKSFAWHECWLPFPRISGDFAGIIDRWFARRAELGPGLHLFLGTRRSMPLYVEHKFVNLAWGLESLHRRIHGDGIPDTNEPTKLELKLERIRSALTSAVWAKPSDEAWVMNLVNRPLEPTLAGRIELLLTSIGIEFDKARLRKFSQRCADLRNDLSHYGGERSPGIYSAVIREYQIFGDALGYLYHLLLLQLVGVETRHLSWLVKDPANRIRQSLVDASVLPTPERPGSKAM